VTTTPPPPALLDTDMLSEVLKQKNASVIQRAADYLHHHHQFTFSAITYYEVLRGLKAKNATKQLQNFATFCQHSTIVDVTRAVLERASDLWVMGEQGGYPHRDADLMIGATALENGLVLVTGNTKDFAWMPGLTIEDWRI
jgi:tRNA(fMet)-specific endonuclease VapC